MPTQKEYVVSTSKLHTRTVEAIANRPRLITYDVIAEECGVTVRWLQQFTSGNIADPGVAKVEAVYEFVTGKKLDV